MASCCAPQGRDGGIADAGPAAAEASAVPAPADAGAGRPVPHDDVAIGAGSFAMGDAFGEGYPDDGETPVHRVRLNAFRIDATAVTNEQFAVFAASTGYRTESERYGSSAVFHLAVQADPADILNRADSAPWWLNVRGADWAHPHGPGSSWRQYRDHPVVQVSYDDALAYCRWAGRRLPTEAQWEYAARGGLDGARYAWGDELVGDDGAHRCNIWQGTFPTENTGDDGFLATAPVRTFEPNGYGLYQTAGNVWEWCADWFLPKYYRKAAEQNPAGPTIGRGRVMRGGSYLCHDSYCNRYRVAARTSNTPDSASGNCGFRTVADSVVVP